MKAERKRLLELADRCIDGEAVDWSRELDSDGDERARRVVGMLRVIEGISRVRGGPAAEDRSVTVKVESPSPLRWGRLQIRGELGRGAYGTVYDAFDPQLQREVALKLVRDESRGEGRTRALLREGRRLARLRHPNVVEIHGVEEHEGQLGLWMERIRGRTLAEILQSDGPYGECEAIDMGVRLARALSAVHGRGVLHRDIKAQNVMRETGGRLVLMDFGAGVELETLAREGGRVPVEGTPHYLAPELLQGHDPSRRSEIYSLGVLLFHLLTRDFPVRATSLEELHEAHARPRESTLADLRPDLCAGLVEVVERAIDPDPARRFASAGQMAVALARLQGKGSLLGELQDLWERSRGLRWFARLAAVVALVGLVWLTVPSLREWVLPGAFRVEASLYREAGSSVREELRSGARVAVGDLLFLELEASRPLHVYVLNRDDEGGSALLFPLAGSSLSNPLPGGERHVLPGSLDGRPVGWEISSAGGREQLLVVAAREPLEELEALLPSLSTPSAGGELVSGYPQVEAETLVRLRGMLRLRPLDSDRSLQSQASELFDEVDEILSGREQQSHDVWVRRLVLENPASGP